MGRVIMWLALWLLSLGTLDIEVHYDDGLSLHLVGWPTRLAELLDHDKQR